MITLSWWALSICVFVGGLIGEILKGLSRYLWKKLR